MHDTLRLEKKIPLKITAKNEKCRAEKLGIKSPMHKNENDLNHKAIMPYKYKFIEQ